MVLYLSFGNMHYSKLSVDENLISSQSKKEMEDFVQANLRIFIQETVFQKTLRTVLKR